MELMIGAAVAVGAAVGVGAFWLVRCNHRTFADVERLTDAIFARRDWLRLIGMANLVSYEAHLWALFRGRDPWALYPAELRALVGK